MAASVAEIEELYRTRFSVFRNGLTRILGGPEPAREAVQEAFARALRDRRRFRGDGSLEAWVWRIAVNYALKSKRELRETWEVTPEPAAPEPEQFDDELAAAMRSLSPRRRLVVFLRYFADLSYGEIAEICNVSEGTVAATLSQSHAELFEQLSTEGARP
jgi:RNA polymerase sigma-70 factor (ECF subfamily)